MRRFLRLTLVVQLVAISALAALVPRPAAALQTGGEYTSPNLGFRIAWDSSWQVIDEAQIEEDSLLLTNGLGNVLLWGLADFPADLRTCAGLWSSILENDPANGDVALVEEGGDTTSAYAVSAFTRSTDAGALDFQDTFECRVIVPGQSILGIAAVTPAINFEQQRSLVAALLSGLVLVPPGEPGPVFAPDGWRFAVVATLRTGTHFSFDLASVPGQEWLLAVLDASNTLPVAAAFQAEQFGVLLDDDAKAVGLDLDHTTRVASRLRAQTLDHAGVEVAPGQTVRLVLVFQIADSTENIALAWTDASVPLDSGLSGGSNLQGLRPVIAPAPLVPATVRAAIDGQTLAVSLAADGATRTVRLTGVEAPLDEACHAAEATDALAIAEGDAVWLEADPAVVVETDGADSLYVWLEKRDGTLILLNRRLVANGDARAADLPDDARFAAWIADAERSAEAKATGLWAGCEAGDDAGDQDAAEATSEIAGNAAPTAAERAYLTALDEDRDFLNLSLLRYRSLMANPQPGDPNWLNELALVLTGWVLLSDGAEDRDPPDRYADLNAAYLAVLEPFDAAAHTAAPNIDDWFTGATDAIDLSGLDLELLQSQVADAEASLGAYVALLDEAVAEAAR